MTVNELCKQDGFCEIFIAEGEREIIGAYAGDLLSWVMGRASADNAFVTIMNNVNVIAVAQLVDVACVIFAENTQVNDEIIAAAKAKQINIVKSTAPVYQTCVALSKLI